MSMSIIPMEDPLLLSPTEIIPPENILHPDIQQKINAMLSLYSGLSAVGLAAPQVGWNARLFIIGIKDEHARGDGTGIPPTVFINPEIEIINRSTIIDWEGCFSVCHRNPHALGQVSRYKTIRYKAYNSMGEMVSGELTNFKARVFQHENDHLDGIRYLNRMTDNSTLALEHHNSIHQLHLFEIPEAIKNPQLTDVLKKVIPVLLKAPYCGITEGLKRKLTVISQGIPPSTTPRRV